MFRSLRLSVLLALALLCAAVLVPGARAWSLTAKADYVSGTGPESVAIGDFNGDGKLDLATANYGANTVSVLLGIGSGSFAAKSDYASGTGPVSVATGDFNGDGTLDLATANPNSNTVSVLLGTGTGSFGAKSDFASGTSPESVATGDFNGDGKLDLATANYIGNTVNVLLGTGTGSFGAKTGFASGTGPVSVATGDFNGDGTLDLAATNFMSNTVSVLLGTGTGSFLARTDFAAGANTMSLATGDFNGDGTLDLAAANLSANTVSVFLGTGSGGFAAKTDFASGPAPQALATGDFNGDGKLDLATANYGANTVSVLLGTGTGTFLAKSDYASGNGPESVATGDFNGDGKPDLASANYGASTLSILLGKYDQTPSGTVSLNGAQTYTGSRLVAVDLAVVEAWQVRLRDQGGQWSTWTPYARHSSWTLAEGADGQRTVEVQCRNDVGGTATMADSIVLDTAEPVTTDDASAGWSTTSPVAVTLTPGDGTGSGVEKTEYKLDAAASWSTSTSVEISGDGAHTLRYRSVDKAGNVEETQFTTVRLDATAPVASVSGVDDAWQRTPVFAMFSATDATSGVAGTSYRLDGGSWTSGWGVLVSGDGDHVLQYRAADVAGNESAAQTVHVNLDTTDPVTTDDASAGWSTTSPVAVTLTPGDGTGSGVEKTEYKLDAAASWSTGTSVEISGDGAHTLRYRSVDKAGNVEETQFSTVRLDATAPVCWVSGVHVAWQRTPVLAVFSATDASSGFFAGTSYKLDGGSWTSGWGVLVSGDGDHVLQYRAADVAGNESAAQTVHVKIDTVGPVTSGLTVSARARKKTAFKILVSDPLCPGATTSATVVIKNSTGKTLKTLPAVPVVIGTQATVAWGKCTLKAGRYKYVVNSTDAAGNAQSKAGGNKLIVK